MHDASGIGEEKEGEVAQEDKTKEIAHCLEESLPTFLETVWEISRVDIEDTLQRVCGKLLKDVSVPWQIRHRRAIALGRLAQAFRDAGQKDHADLSQSSTVKQH